VAPLQPLTHARQDPSSLPAVGSLYSTPHVTSEPAPKTSVEAAPSSAGAEPQPAPLLRPPPEPLSASSPFSFQSQPQHSTTPPESPRQAPAKPVFTEADRHKLASIVARVGLTQPNGLLKSYVEFALREILTPVFNQHQRELRQAAIG
jgi:hypothetical protein